jgi:hypothetical protein
VVDSVYVSLILVCICCMTDDNKSEFSMASSTIDGTSMGSSTVDNVPNAENMKDGNKWHRVIKHRDVNVLTKYVMGLETYHDYYFRCLKKQ